LRRYSKGHHTALTTAAQFGKVDAMYLLLDNGATVDFECGRA